LTRLAKHIPIWVLAIACLSGQSFSFFQNSESKQSLDPSALNRELLEETLIRFTNRVRKEHRLVLFRPDSSLQMTARKHSEEMARMNYFSHRSPVSANQTMEQRFENSGIILRNVMLGENIGVDYFLDIAGKPYYKETRNGKIVCIDAKTEEPIPFQTYESFSRQMVSQWMKSPGHRENILNRNFNRIGLGTASGLFQGYPAIYVTQNFLGSVD
jgi:uncharacterized protein YkwD